MNKVYNYFERLKHMLLDNDYIKGKDDDAKWKYLFDKINIMQKKYFIEYKKLKLKGVDGWFLNIHIGEFLFNMCENQQYIEEYILVFWNQTISEADKKYYKNQKYYDIIIDEFQEEESVKEINKKEFFDDLRERLTISYEKYKNTKDKSIEEKNYLVADKILKEIYIKDNINKVLKINDLGEDENVWYIIESKSNVFIILIQDFM